MSKNGSLGWHSHELMFAKTYLLDFLYFSENNEILTNAKGFSSLEQTETYFYLNKCNHSLIFVRLYTMSWFKTLPFEVFTFSRFAFQCQWPLIQLCVGIPGSCYRDSGGAALCVSPGWGLHSSDDTDCLTVHTNRRTREAWRGHLSRASHPLLLANLWKVLL